MQLRYGSLSWQVGTAGIFPAFRALRDARGRPYAHLLLVRIEGTLQYDGSAALTIAELTMRAVLLAGGRDTNLVLVDDNNQPTACNFLAAGSVEGIIMTSLVFPNPNQGAGEYVTKREFVAEFEAEYVGPGTGVGTLLMFSEAVSATGDGGPRVKWQEAINGPPPVAIVINPRTVCRGAQAGEAVGWLRYPQVPSPIYGYPYLQNPDSAVDYLGPSGIGLTDWRVRWKYLFEGDKPFTDKPPTFWPGVTAGRL